MCSSVFFAAVFVFAFVNNFFAIIFPGIIYFKLNDMASAEEYLQRALMLDTTLPALNYYLSLVHFQSKDYNTAESDLLYEGDNNPENDVVQYQLGRTSAMLENVPAAIQHLEKALEISPKNETYQRELERLSAK